MSLVDKSAKKLLKTLIVFEMSLTKFIITIGLLTSSIEDCQGKRGLIKGKNVLSTRFSFFFFSLYTTMKFFFGIKIYNFPFQFFY